MRVDMASKTLQLYAVLGCAEVLYSVWSAGFARAGKELVLLLCFAPWLLVLGALSDGCKAGIFRLLTGALSLLCAALIPAAVYFGIVDAFLAGGLLQAAGWYLCLWGMLLLLVFVKKCLGVD